MSGVLLTPTIYPYVAVAVARLLKPLWGIEGRLAGQQLSRNSLRSGLTAAVLCVALVISIAMGQSIRKQHHRHRAMVGANLSGRLPLAQHTAELSYAVAAQLPEELRDELRKLPDVQTVHELNLVQAKVGGEAVVIVARSFDAAGHRGIGYRRRDAGRDHARPAFGRGRDRTALARRLNLGVGDSLELHTRRGDRTVRITGTVTEYIAGGMAPTLNGGRRRISSSSTASMSTW